MLFWENSTQLGQILIAILGEFEIGSKTVDRYNSGDIKSSYDYQALNICKIVPVTIIRLTRV